MFYQLTTVHNYDQNTAWKCEIAMSTNCYRKHRRDKDSFWGISTSVLFEQFIKVLKHGSVAELIQIN